MINVLLLSLIKNSCLHRIIIEEGIKNYGKLEIMIIKIWYFCVKEKKIRSLF